MSNIQILQGDALDTMRTLDSETFDALITDPPYCSGSVSEASRTAAKGQGLRSENLNRFGWFVGDNMGTAGLVFLLRSIAFEAVRILKPSGSMLVFCDWRMIPNLAPAIESAGLRFQNLVVWDKQSFGLGKGFRAQHEMILHFTVGSPEYHAFDCANIIKSPRIGAERVHQTEKPIGLLEQLIKVVTPEGGAILDPFGGSGSTGIAAANLGRSAVCIERSADYVEIANRRIRQEIQPLLI